ncbi:glutathione S-transferase [Lacimonas salitolerans]|uniref:Glutathione S-transferase n=1 Tax=Lacimonas salitolerans TaxID=1323750 RepID=A0ABW4EEI0_9RHOB
MTYDLLIGQRAYSSWSLRGWLPFDAFDIPVRVHRTRLYSPEFASEVATFAGGRTVPAAKAPDGSRLTDSLAIAWHLAEAFPDHGLLPAPGPARAMAQSLICEMHTGFGALRQACPMNLLTGWAGFDPSPAVQADLARIEAIWQAALDQSSGPFLFGSYTLADAFFAPVAVRIAGYDLPVGDAAQAYVAAQLGHPPMRRWRAMAIAENRVLSGYDQPLDRMPYPAPAALPARAVPDGPSVNAACPYSGKPVTDFLELEGRIWGFCNPFCRDKTVADPAAWAKFMAMCTA